MKKLIPLLALPVLLLLGCDTSTDEVSYTRTNQEMSLKITHRVNGNSVTITMKSAADAKAYRERLEKLIKEIESFEKELSIREKGN